MLTTLRIEHFAIVKELELDFSSGMTAFTGETGAGKSIMIDALLLALGGRADVSVIRPGEEKCDISASFQIEKDSEPFRWLQANDLDCEEETVILRRVLYVEGRSKSYINGHPFPLQKVKELSEMLVHIHGQHEHQTLMQHSTHREQLDRYAGHFDLLAQVQGLHKSCQKIKQELDFLTSQGEANHKIELLQFQIEELQAANIQANEMQLLHEEHQLLHHAQDYLQAAQQIHQLLNDDDAFNIGQALNQILQILQTLPQEQSHVKNSQELINNAIIQCEEVLDEIKQFSEQIQLDPERLQEVEERMSVLHQLGRKYHVDANFLPQHVVVLKDELQQINNAEHKIAQLQRDYQAQLKQFEASAHKLRESRQLHAKKLSADITSIIQQLGMPKGQVSIDITPLDKMQAHGLDRVEYKVCTNPGQSPDSLAKIASGGELSRISLAIQMITAQRGSTPTLLFDEVDVGIGGPTAALVGQLLRKLGERLQVFCVTHQPQVASCAHHHFVVEKHSDNQHTYSRIIALDEHEKVNEIARMLGGLTITEQTRSHARELLAQQA
ncbi:DNA repair protein RecN [Legionella jordanis]|uniref:DNA repair protein RecN n=1 Tax=Legionella jordanis TaxID=456 RepID=A0A0W0VD98_9GAMM|nr:DNA repair protein RecN [Legionella jordanis]KTD18080.1 DNA repair protein recN [Legionella jordanis]RMX00604.1 DNA repair protein RecN [Legionella jordanis]RMX21280.1 DNA repair protein RecN [Legionella jordanis]VEH13828.1 DNA repair ATPase [Legionella jordanis]HAT8714209.1 DNA repair protein RecN [Legionella jordanis]